LAPLHQTLRADFRIRAGIGTRTAAPGSMRGIFEREDFDRLRLDASNKSAVNRPPDERRVAIFAAPSTPVRGGTMFRVCAFSGNACFRGRRRKLRYASDRFIVARCAVPDRAPAGADRRHRGGEPAFGRRIDRAHATTVLWFGSAASQRHPGSCVFNCAKADWFIPRRSH